MARSRLRPRLWNANLSRRGRSRGFAVVTCCYAQISPDVEVREGDPPDLAWTGIFDIWGPRDPVCGDNPTALGAWAWALSRGLDLAERIPEIDAARSVATGCSRLGYVHRGGAHGQSALDWAWALDFAERAFGKCGFLSDQVSASIGER